VIKGFLNDAFVQQLAKYQTLFVGFSGGLDSTALLHQLARHPTLSQKIHAVHINHGLSAHAAEWEQHCKQFCAKFAIALSVHHVKIDPTNNVEERARTARFVVFNSLLTPKDALVLAHHENDQAETLLLNLMRGAGVDGMAAMDPVQTLERGDVLRPFLSYSRDMMEEYVRYFDLSWVEDESNQDERFSRNFLRHQVLPLLQEKWPQAIQNIARGARLCRQALQNLEALAEMDCKRSLSPNLLSQAGEASLDIAPLIALPRSRMLNVLRIWIKKNGSYRPSEKTLNRLIDEVMLARVDAAPEVSFGDVVVRRFQGALYCCRSFEVKQSDIAWETFPNTIQLEALRSDLHALPSNEGFYLPSSSLIKVRFRRGGEEFRWRGQTKSLKQLFHQWQVPPWRRDKVPLLYVNDELAVVVGYAVSDNFYSNKQAYKVRLTYTQ